MDGSAQQWLNECRKEGRRAAAMNGCCYQVVCLVHLEVGYGITCLHSHEPTSYHGGGGEEHYQQHHHAHPRRRLLRIEQS
jgi:hypothetical protein